METFAEEGDMFTQRKKHVCAKQKFKLHEMNNSRLCKVENSCLQKEKIFQQRGHNHVDTKSFNTQVLSFWQ